MAQCITREMGKPIKQARAEVTKSAALCDWYAEHGPAMLNPEPTLVENQQAVIEYRPLGVILAIMPWNFPLWQVLRGAVPILLAGNSYLLKHAPNVTGCAQMIARILTEAGTPAGVYGWVNANNEGVSQMINDPRIAAVTVTGSVRAGAAIGAQAGAALKKCVLELGGSDPFIVLNDADLELAVKAAVAGRYQNTGQVCAAAKRFIVEEGIAQAFTDRFVAAAAALKMGILWLKRMIWGRWRALICVMNSINRCRLPSPKATATVGRRENRRGGQLLCRDRSGGCHS